MEIHVRKAGFEDLKHILHQRRAMFEEMGFRASAVLDRVEELSLEYFSQALRIGTYRGWLAEELTGRSWAVAALWLRIGRAIPVRIVQNEPGFLTCIRSLKHDAVEWRNACWQ
jgi:hypothetical protein